MLIALMGGRFLKPWQHKANSLEGRLESGIRFSSPTRFTRKDCEKLMLDLGLFGWSAVEGQ